MSNIRSKATKAVVVVTPSSLLVAGAAGAQATDPTNGEYGSAMTEITGFVTDFAAAPLFGLAVASTAILVGVKWVKKARGAAS